MKGCNGLGADAASKWGMRGLTRVAARELAPHGIRVNSIHPGGITTMMGNPMGSAENEANQAYAGQPIQRIGGAAAPCEGGEGVHRRTRVPVVYRTA